MTPKDYDIYARHTAPLMQYRLLHDIYVLLDAGDHVILRDFNLTNSQYRVLTLLDPVEGQQLMTLSDRMLCARSTITRLIDQMEAQNWVHRIADPHDRRAQRVMLTPEGTALRERARAAHETSLRERLDFLNQTDLQQLADILEKIRTHLQDWIDNQNK